MASVQSEFYVETSAGNFVPAKFIQLNGQYLVDPNGSAQSVPLYDVNGMQIAVNTSGYLVVPQDYSFEQAQNAANVLIDAQNNYPQTSDGGMAALGAVASVLYTQFRQGGSEELQRTYDGGQYGTNFVGAFTDAASFHLGLVSTLGGLPAPAAQAGGGLYNDFNSIIRQLNGQSPLDMSGDFWGNTSRNAKSIPFGVSTAAQVSAAEQTGEVVVTGHNANFNTGDRGYFIDDQNSDPQDGITNTTYTVYDQSGNFVRQVVFDPGTSAVTQNNSGFQITDSNGLSIVVQPDGTFHVKNVNDEEAIDPSQQIVRFSGQTVTATNQQSGTATTYSANSEGSFDAQYGVSSADTTAALYSTTSTDQSGNKITQLSSQDAQGDDVATTTTRDTSGNLLGQTVTITDPAGDPSTTHVLGSGNLSDLGNSSQSLADQMINAASGTALSLFGTSDAQVNASNGSLSLNSTFDNPTTATLFGASESATLSGNSASLTLDGVNASVLNLSNGDFHLNTLTILANSSANVMGGNLSVDLGDNGQPNAYLGILTGSRYSVGGSGETWATQPNVGLSVFGNNNIGTLGGQGNLLGLAGMGDVTSSTGNNISETTGSSSTVNGNSNVNVLNGSGITLTQSGGTVEVGQYNNSETVNGNNQMVRVGSNVQIAVNGSGDTIMGGSSDDYTVSGNDDKVYSDGSTADFTGNDDDLYGQGDDGEGYDNYYASGGGGGYGYGYGYGSYGGYGFALGTALKGTNIGKVAAFDNSLGAQTDATVAQTARLQAAATQSVTAEVTSLAAQFEGPSWHEQVITWSLANGPGTSASQFTSSLGSQYERTVENAFATWAAASGLKFQEVADSNQSDIRIGFSDLGGAADDGALGYTNIKAQYGVALPSATISLEDPNQDALVTDAYGQLSYSGTQTELPQLLLHEIGHALGLADDADPQSILSATLGAGNRTLDATDIAGINLLYPHASGVEGAINNTSLGMPPSAALSSLRPFNAQAAQLIQALASFTPPSAASAEVLQPQDTGLAGRYMSLASHMAMA